MAFERVYPAKFGSLWEANYPTKRTFSLPTSKSVVWSAKANLPNDVIFNSGISHLAFNDGNVSSAPYSKSGLFVSSPQWIKGYANSYLGGKTLENFTQQDCLGLVQTQLNERGGLPSIVTTGSSEWKDNPGDSNKAWAQAFIFIPPNGATPVPQQYHWIDQAWVTTLGSSGSYFGDYDGHGASQAQIDQGSIENLRAGYQSNEGAWNFVSTQTPFGNPFFTDNAYLYRNGLVKTYWNGYTDPRRRLFAIATDLIFSKKALSFKNYTRKIMSFAFPGATEFINRSEFYSRDVGGGTVSTPFFPQYAHGINTIIGTISLILSDVLYMWEDCIRFGSDYNRIAYDAGPYNGSAPRDPANVYDYTSSGVGFPSVFVSGHNAMFTGVEFYSRAVAWASANYSYASSRIPGGIFNSTNNEYMINNYLSGKPVGFLFKSGNKRALFCYDINSFPGTQTYYDWDCDGEIIQIKMTSGVPYLYLGEITQQVA